MSAAVLDAACPARRFFALSLLLLLGTLAACSPALDWREVRPAGSQVQLLFPCKPSAQARLVNLAGRAVRLSLHACSADGQTWALAHADMGDPAQIGVALTELLSGAAANLGAEPRPGPSLQVSGATPHAFSQRQRLAGHLPDGTPVLEEVAVFTYGTRVYQATALGELLPAEAVQTFMQSLRIDP